MHEKCPLCHSIGEEFYRSSKQLFFLCSNCIGIYAGKKYKLNCDEEKKRYKLHQNNVEDKKYQEFVFPIVNAITNDFYPKSKGLDFGAGTGSVISKLLNDKGYNIVQYDPFFHYSPELLKQRFNYIACCEVMEHFYEPDKEFYLLKNLLHPQGRLYCMTELYNESIDFKNWYYKNDPTHVFIYQQKTINMIKIIYNFSDVKINNRLICFET